MAVTIRLRRTGARNLPLYRIVVADSRSPVKGRFIEKLGWYDPRAKKVEVDKNRVLHWVSKGARISTITLFFNLAAAAPTSVLRALATLPPFPITLPISSLATEISRRMTFSAFISWTFTCSGLSTICVTIYSTILRISVSFHSTQPNLDHSTRQWRSSTVSPPCLRTPF